MSTVKEYLTVGFYRAAYSKALPAYPTIALALRVDRNRSICLTINAPEILFHPITAYAGTPGGSPGSEYFGFVVRGLV